jgi:hypothetical protein
VSATHAAGGKGIHDAPRPRNAAKVAPMTEIEFAVGSGAAPEDASTKIGRAAILVGPQLGDIIGCRVSFRDGLQDKTRSQFGSNGTNRPTRRAPDSRDGSAEIGLRARVRSGRCAAAL